MKANLAKKFAWILLCMLFVGGFSTNMRASGGPAPLPPGIVANLH